MDSRRDRSRDRDNGRSGSRSKDRTESERDRNKVKERDRDRNRGRDRGRDRGGDREKIKDLPDNVVAHKLKHSSPPRLPSPSKEKTIQYTTKSEIQEENRKRIEMIAGSESYNLHELISLKHREKVDEKLELKEPSGLDYEIHSTSYFEHEMCNDCAWLELPESIIGLEVGLTLAKYQLTSDMSQFGIIRMGTLVVAVLAFLLQLYVLYTLWISLPPLYMNVDFCHNDEISRKLQLCAVGVFLLSINASFKDITLELLVVLTSKRLKRDPLPQDLDLVRVKTNNRFWTAKDICHIRILAKTIGWKVICVFLIMMELCVWFLALVVGCKYLLISETVSNLVQSMVAIVFINDIDNLGFSAFVPRNVKKTLNRIYFECPYLKGPGGSKRNETTCLDCLTAVINNDDGTDKQAPSKAQLFIRKHLYTLSLLGSVPIIIFTSVCVVYGLHITYC